VSSERNKKNGRFPENGYAIPAELFPDKITVEGIDFTLGNKTDGKNNVIACQGQKIPLPEVVKYNRIYILAASTHDTTAIFKTGESKKSIRIQSCTGKIGQFDLRIWDKFGRLKGIDPGFIKRDEVALFTTHLHKDTMNLPYQYAYVFKYSMDASPSAGYLQLPNIEGVKIFAITLAENSYDQLQPARPLYDDFTDRKGFPLALEKRIVTENVTPVASVASVRKRNLNDLPYKVMRNDYADMRMPNGVVVNYYHSGTEKIKQNEPGQGMMISAVNDGMFDLLTEDSLREVWFEKGEGRIVMDLQKSLDIDSIHIFSVLDTKRGAPSFSLWLSEGEKVPSFTGDPKPGEWKYAVSVSPVDIWGNSKVVYTIKPLKGKPLTGRYLMWVTEESSHGPYYFREVDVFERQK
jgi:hypothetical protein